MSRGGDGKQRRPWLWAVIGSFVCLVGVIFTLASLSAWAERDDYRRAATCLVNDTQDCAREMGAEVESTFVKYRRSDRYYVTLPLDQPQFARPRAGVRVEIPEPDRVFDALETGRRVRVRLWDGKVARIDVTGVGSAETEHSPLVASLEGTLLGLGAAAGGATAVWLGAALRRRSGGWFRRTPETASFTARGAHGVVGRALLAATTASLVAFVQVVMLDVYSAVALWVTLGGVSVLVFTLMQRKVEA